MFYFILFYLSRSNHTYLLIKDEVKFILLLDILNNIYTKIKIYNQYGSHIYFEDFTDFLYKSYHYYNLDNLIKKLINPML